MLKIKKDFNTKIVALVVSISFLFTTTLYSYPISKDTLRVPVQIDEKRAEEALYKIFCAEKKPVLLTPEDAIRYLNDRRGNNVLVLNRENMATKDLPKGTIGREKIKSGELQIFKLSKRFKNRSYVLIVEDESEPCLVQPLVVERAQGLAPVVTQGDISIPPNVYIPLLPRIAEKTLGIDDISVMAFFPESTRQRVPPYTFTVTHNYDFTSEAPDTNKTILVMLPTYRGGPSLNRWVKATLNDLRKLPPEYSFEFIICANGFGNGLKDSTNSVVEEMMEEFKRQGIKMTLLSVPEQVGKVVPVNLLRREALIRNLVYSRHNPRQEIYLYFCDDDAILTDREESNIGRAIDMLDEDPGLKIASFTLIATEIKFDIRHPISSLFEQITSVRRKSFGVSLIHLYGASYVLRIEDVWKEEIPPEIGYEDCYLAVKYYTGDETNPGIRTCPETQVYHREQDQWRKLRKRFMRDLDHTIRLRRYFATHYGNGALVDDFLAARDRSHDDITAIIRTYPFYHPTRILNWINWKLKMFIKWQDEHGFIPAEWAEEPLFSRVGRDEEAVERSIEMYHYEDDIYYLLLAANGIGGWQLSNVATARLLQEINAANVNTLTQIVESAQRNRIPLGFKISQSVLSRATHLGATINLGGERLRLVERITDRVFKAINSEGDSFAVRLSFQEEYDILQGLEHPNIITPFSYDSIFNCMLSFSIDRMPLIAYLESNPPLDEMLNVILQVAEGVGEMHRVGLRYGYIARCNAVVDKKGKVVITDSGLWELSNSLSEKADIFGLGALLYCAFTNIIPAEDDPYTPILNIPPVLNDIIARALIKGEDGAKGYQSFAEVKQDLYQIQLAIGRETKVVTREAVSTLRQILHEKVRFINDRGERNITVQLESELNEGQLIELLSLSIRGGSSWQAVNLATEVIITHISLVAEGIGLANIFKIAEQEQIPLRYEISKAVLKRAMALGCSMHFRDSDFFVTEQIGRVAFKAIDAEDRNVVMKISYPKEYERLKILSHENIAGVSSYDRITRIMWLEFIEAVDYWGFLASGPTIDDVCDVTIQICDALGYINSKGFLYRDTAPNNLLVVKLPSGKWKAVVIDFEVTEALNDRSPFLNILEVGILLYYTFTGARYPRFLEYHTEFTPHFLGHYYPIPQISPGFNNIIRKALFKDPTGEIYHSLEEVATDLKTLVHRQPKINMPTTKEVTEGSLFKMPRNLPESISDFDRSCL